MLLLIHRHGQKLGGHSTKPKLVGTQYPSDSLLTSIGPNSGPGKIIDVPQERAASRDIMTASDANNSHTVLPESTEAVLEATVSAEPCTPAKPPPTRVLEARRGSEPASLDSLAEEGSRGADQLSSPPGQAASADTGTEGGTCFKSQGQLNDEEPTLHCPGIAVKHQ